MPGPGDVIPAGSSRPCAPGIGCLVSQEPVHGFAVAALSELLLKLALLAQAGANPRGLLQARRNQLAPLLTGLPDSCTPLPGSTVPWRCADTNRSA